MGAQVGGLFTMAIKVLLDEGGELRMRITGESHTALQLFRSRLNDNKDVEYANKYLTFLNVIFFFASGNRYGWNAVWVVKNR